MKLYSNISFLSNNNSEANYVIDNTPRTGKGIEDGINN